MNDISMTVKDVRGSHKRLSLRRILESERLDVVLIQETMVSKEKACEFFGKLANGWEMTTLDVLGSLGGLATLWNLGSFNLIPFLTSVGILVEAIVLKWDLPIRVLHYYAPYNERQDFWQKMVREGIF